MGRYSEEMWAAYAKSWRTAAWRKRIGTVMNYPPPLWHDQGWLSRGGK